MLGHPMSRNMPWDGSETPKLLRTSERAQNKLNPMVEARDH